MASLADSGRAVVLMALETNSHGRDAGGFGHAIHILHLPVAHLAFHSCFQMFTMRPIYSWENFVDSHPGDGLACF